MSAAPARVREYAAPAAPRPSTASPRPELRVLPEVPFRAPRGPFVLVVGAVMTLGLIGVLLLNTVVAKDAFEVSELQARAAALADEEQALTQQVAVAESPQKLATRAEALGMVASENPVFLRLADGKVLGDPVAGKSVRQPAAPGTDAATTGTPGTTTTTTTSTTSTTSTTPTTPTALKTKAALAPDRTPNAIKTKAAR